MSRDYRTNEVKVDIASYIHYWRGIRKVGKTTLFRDLLIEEYGNADSGLLISCGNEDGYQALDGLRYDVAEDWGTLEEIVDDLVDNRKDNDFKIVGLDTADEIVKLAKEECRRLHRKQKGVSVEFNACFGGYGAPRDKVSELIDGIITKLKRAGYGIIIIGHTKIRDIKEKNGDEYQQLTSNLSADYDGIFANKADIIMTIAVEKEISDNHISSVQRYMWFRNDGFVDAGGRFDCMPEKVEFGPRNYINAFEEGVKKAIKHKTTDKDIKLKRAKEVSARDEAAEDYVENLKTAAANSSKNNELVPIIQNKFPNATAEVKSAVKKIMADYGFTDFKDEQNIPTKALEEIVKLLA